MFDVIAVLVVAAYALLMIIVFPCYMADEIEYIKQQNKRNRDARKDLDDLKSKRINK